jgi:hypothetical protein
LDASSKEGFYFYEPTPQPLTVERDRTCPIALMKKGALCQPFALNQITAISMSI